jgi:small multidrug resistance family-3 protein
LPYGHDGASAPRRLGRFLAFYPLLSLALFGRSLAQVETAAAGRAFAACGGVHVAASLGSMWLVEGQKPDRRDPFGAAICLVGATVILAAPHRS